MASKPELKIAMLSAHSCPVGQLGTKDTGGMSVYIRELAKELGRQGHGVEIFTRVHDRRDPISKSLARERALSTSRPATTMIWTS
ncbi:MAG: hypothetical protein C4555_03800 [Dehalococcoidia bacterium]|nr:MAG: hypothetical protein C4555_03800 [Dehalococcoidia bacterium]